MTRVYLLHNAESSNVSFILHSEIPIFRTLQGKRKLSGKIVEFEKSEVKLQCWSEERETTFGSSYWEVRKIEGSRNRDSTVTVYISTTNVIAAAR